MDIPLPNLAVQDELVALELQLTTLMNQEVEPGKEREREDEIAILAQSIEGLRAEEFIVSEEAIAHFRQLSEQFSISDEESIVYDSRLTFLTQLLLDGGITLDDYIQQVDIYFTMVSEEGA